jgi:hypothetical protein
MCRKCWDREYRQRPEVKEKEQRRSQRPEVRHRLQCMRAKVAECAGCKQEKKLCHLGLCRTCYDHQRYGGKENCDCIRREQAKRYRKTPGGKVMVKAYNALESTTRRKREHKRKQRRDPLIGERYRQYNRRWWESRPEEYRKAQRQRYRRWYFLYTGKPVGPFDPNEIRNEGLLKTLKEVREGNP